MAETDWPAAGYEEALLARLSRHAGSGRARRWWLGATAGVAGIALLGASAGIGAVPAPFLGGSCLYQRSAASLQAGQVGERAASPR